MNRRELLQLLALLAGGALAPSVVHALSSGVDGRGEIQNRRVNKRQRAMCSVLAEMIIPKTDTPGAIEAGVPHFIELMVSDWYTDTERRIFLSGLQTLDTFCRQQFGGTFLHCRPEDRAAALTQMEKAAAEYRGAPALPFRTAADENEPFFNKLKELTVLGYYTSEVGAKQELRYLPMPMEYRDIDFAEVGRQWSF